MKNFFTIVSKQGKLKECNYKVDGNDDLIMDTLTRFPLIHLINGYIEENEKEKIKITAIREDNDISIKNANYLDDELKKIAKLKKFNYEIEYIVTSDKQDILSLITNVQKIIDHTEDDSTIYACLTYGTKPQSKALEMAINYADKCRFNTYVDCIVYGHVVGNHEADILDGTLYDITAMTKLNDIVNTLAERKVSDPYKHLSRIINMEI